MCAYHHLTIDERESILFFHSQGKNIRSIAKEIGRNPSTVSRELRNNFSNNRRHYHPSGAQWKYNNRRRNCRKKRILETDRNLQSLISHLIKDMQWSPQEISQRLKMEQSIHISYNTIYRAIQAGDFEANGKRPKKVKGFEKYLRRKGRVYKKRGEKEERRGKFVIRKMIYECPKAAKDRSELGHMECDTVQGKNRAWCVLTCNDRKSRYLIAKLLKKSAEEVNAAMREIAERYEIKSMTPDQGKEFAGYEEIMKATGIPFYFAEAGKPWQRRTNENSNGLLREYMPKGKSFDIYTDENVQEYVRKLNLRPKKVLGWKTPFEVFFNVVLHLT